LKKGEARYFSQIYRPSERRGRGESHFLNRLPAKKIAICAGRRAIVLTGGTNQEKERGLFGGAKIGPKGKEGSLV